MLTTTFLTLYRDALVWWAAAMIAPFETVYDAVDSELARRDVP